MGKSGRPLLVHYHVYKNAGTSVEKNLSDSFGHQWAVCEGDREHAAPRLSSNGQRAMKPHARLSRCEQGQGLRAADDL